MKRILAVTAAALLTAALSAPALAEEADKAPQGKALFTKYKCNTCHSVESQDIKRLRPPAATAAHKPPDLSKVGDTRGHEWIEKFITKQETIATRKHPILFRGTKDEKETLAAWLETLKSGEAETGAEGAAKEAKEAAKEAKEEAKDAKEHSEKAEDAAKDAAKAASEAAKDTTHAH